jgi:hypothetical protein
VLFNDSDCIYIIDVKNVIKMMEKTSATGKLIKTQKFMHAIITYLDEEIYEIYKIKC